MANNKKKKGYGWIFTMKNETKYSEKKICFLKQNMGYTIIKADKAQIMFLMGYMLHDCTTDLTVSSAIF